MQVLTSHRHFLRPLRLTISIWGVWNIGVAALVSKRLVGGRRLFKQMATEVFEFIYATWQAVLDPTLQGYSHEIDQEQVGA